MKFSEKKELSSDGESNPGPSGIPGQTLTNRRRGG